MSTLLVLGTLAADWLATLTAAAACCSLELRLVPDFGLVPDDSVDGIRAVVLGRLPAGSNQAAERLRQDERLEHVAVFATAIAPTTAEYVAALTAGIDDLLTEPEDVLGVEVRLRAARDAGDGSPPSLRRGLAWSIGPTGGRSAARARALRGAGFRATSLLEPADAPWLGEPRLAVVVWETHDEGRALAEVRRARQAGVLCRFVLCVPSATAAELGRECEKLDGVRVLPELAPPDGVVFLVNEMAQSTVQNQRASRRRPATTLVRFRGGGRADLGLSYNVSAGGLYIRTLAPAVGGQVQLSIDVGGSAAIELGCEVAWSRALSYDGTATAPPGFGVRIVEASDASRAALTALAQD